MNENNLNPTINNEDKYKWALEVMAAYFKSPKRKDKLINFVESRLNGHDPDQIEVYSTIVDVIEWEGYQKTDETIYIKANWNKKDLSSYKGIVLESSNIDSPIAEYNTGNFFDDVGMVELFERNYPRMKPYTVGFIKTSSVIDYENSYWNKYGKDPETTQD